jgi:integrase
MQAFLFVPVQFSEESKQKKPGAILYCFRSSKTGRATLSGEGLIIEFDIPAYLGASIPIPMRLRSRFDKLLKEAGLPHMRFHDLRHSSATILLSMGVPAKVVQEILRHSNISTTFNIYAHVLPEMHRDALEKMDTFLRGAREGGVI